MVVPQDLLVRVSPLQLGWHLLRNIRAAIKEAKVVTNKPTLIKVGFSGICNILCFVCCQRVTTMQCTFRNFRPQDGEDSEIFSSFFFCIFPIKLMAIHYQVALMMVCLITSLLG